LGKKHCAYSLLHYSNVLLYEAWIVAFEIEYGQWVEEKERRNEELRHALAATMEKFKALEGFVNQVT